jgi:hypothetical protein
MNEDKELRQRFLHYQIERLRASSEIIAIGAGSHYMKDKSLKHRIRLFLQPASGLVGSSHLYNF